MREAHLETIISDKWWIKLCNYSTNVFGCIFTQRSNCNFVPPRLKHSGKLMLEVVESCRGSRERSDSSLRVVCQMASIPEARFLSGVHSAVVTQPHTRIPAASAQFKVDTIVSCVPHPVMPSQGSFVD